MGTRVFVGGLTYRVRERDLERFFRKYGRVKEVAMKNGFAFVEFDDHRDADDAVYELNGKELLGERVSVEKARGTPRGSDVWRGSGHGRSLAPLPRRPSRVRDREPDYRSNDRYGPPTRTEYRLIVENLSSRVSWQDLKDYMRQAGEVTYADAHKDRRNEGVVEFATHSDMKNALDKLDDTELNGRRIRLVEDRRGGGRRSRSSSSRSRSRSRSRRTRSRSRSRRSSRSRSRRSSRSKSKSRSRSRSKSRGKDRSKSKSRSRSRSESKKQSRSKSRSQSVSKGKPKERSRSPSKEKSKSKSRSPEKNGDRSPEVQDN
ncbi:serine-arginine protein 55 isoform X2 [Macrosteles quadrilineatus]|uniref:serine-arginine protein 55 isoform X2 n=1 Tax=Macrosteles quadrilineatus TaxID=74068 RepID=UPI0023E11295|nr:serine-arginine protein 55 isoform X2 [Macrosteles quadrilineatus]